MSEMDVSEEEMKVRGIYVDLPKPYTNILLTLKERTTKSFKTLIMEAVEMLAMDYKIINKPRDLSVPRLKR